MTYERLQKVMANRGMASRRESEEYIRSGYVWVNGVQVTEMGLRVDPAQTRIELRLPHTISYTTIAFYKPRGVVSNLPQNGETEIRDWLPDQYKELSCVGRLDKDSEGLILLTNDGVLSRHLLTGYHEREYIVRVDQPFTKGMEERLVGGVTILGEAIRPIVINPVGSHSFHIILTEGKNQHIRRLCAKVGLHVVQLKRIRIGSIVLGGLEKGSYREVPPHAFDWLISTPS